MKKILLTILSIAFIAINANAQLPAGSFFEFEFTGGSLANTSASGAPNFTGSINSIADRNGDPNDAVDITSTLSGASVGATNVNEMTLSFWMRHTPLTANERILQIYGTWGNGFRLQMDGNQLVYNGKAGNGSGSPSNSEFELVNIDDNAWHHIAVRTSLIGTDTLKFDVFLDNILQPNISNTTINVSGAITNFLLNANLVISPTNNYSGDIDDIYFYKSSLTDTEIAQIYFNNNPCTVNIPDANFKAYLVGNAAINTNGDTEIQCSEASTFTGTINCNNSTISDLTGIETFTALTELYCDNNPFTSIDLSQNTALELLYINNHALSSLDVTQNTALTLLDCGYGTLNSLDVSQNTALTRLYINNNSISSINLSTLNLLEQLECGHNALTSLDLSQNSSLSQLLCFNNQLTTLDVSQNTSLQIIRCRNNQISTLDVSQNILLTQLSCQVNTITSLDLSQNTNLLYLYCYNNAITSLDLSQNSFLSQLDCENNSLTSLNMANGNNTNVNYFYTSGNASLNCIKVDDETYSTTNWINIDAHTSFSNTCTVLINSIIVQGQGGVSTITTQGGTLQMEATILPANADDATYTWSVTNGTGAATIDTNGLLTASADGTVTVTATANDASGIAGTKPITISNQTTNPGTGINGLTFEKLSIFPNPTSGIVNLDILETLSSVRVMDLTGKILKVFNSEERHLDISEFTSGIYFLEIANEERKSVVKIIKK